MKQHRIAMLTAILLTAACTSTANSPTPVLISTKISPEIVTTFSPTFTSTELSIETPTFSDSEEVQQATETPNTPTITPFILPDEAPLKVWRGIPIMAGAIAGREGNNSYLFTTPVSIGKVQRFYLNQLRILGWEVQATGSKVGALVIAQKSGVFASIAVSPHENGVTVVQIAMEE